MLVKLQYVIVVLVLNHVLAVVAEEHIVGRDVGADLQLHQRIFGIVGIADFSWIFRQSGTVAAYIDRAPDVYGLFFCSCQADGHLLGVGAEEIQGSDRLQALSCSDTCFLQYLVGVVIEVHRPFNASQSGIVGIGIRAVAAAIDVAEDVGVDTYGVAAGNLA